MFIEQFPLVKSWFKHWEYARLRRMGSCRGGGSVSVLSMKVRKSLSEKVKIEQRHEGRKQGGYVGI